MTTNLMALPQGDVRWTGDELVFATFGGAKKIAALQRRPEYVLAQSRYVGTQQAAASIAEIDRPGLRMARIALRPTWVGVLDFQSRFPGGTAADFARRGR